MRERRKSSACVVVRVHNHCKIFSYNMAIPMVDPGLLE